MNRIFVILLAGLASASALFFYNRVSLKTEFQTIETPHLKQVYLFEDNEADTVRMHLNYPSGEIANPYTEGLAHYVEHLVAHRFFSDGAEAGRHKNAWTSHLVTAYWTSVKNAKASEAIEALVSTALPLEIDAKFAAEERGIVLREYELRNADDPMQQVFSEVDQALYSGGPAARSILGHPEEIEQFSLPEAIKLHSQSHHLAGATLFIYGKISKSEVRSALEEIQWPEPTLSPLPITENLVTEVGFDRQLEIVEIDSGKTVDLIYKKLVPVDGCDRDITCFSKVDVLENILDSAMDGGIAGPLRYDAFVARNFSFDVYVPGPNIIGISFTASADRDVPHRLLLATFERVLYEKLNTPIPQASFERAKARALDGVDPEDIDPIDSYKSAIDWVSSGLPPYSTRQIQSEASAVTKGDVENLASQMAKPGREIIRYLK